MRNTKAFIITSTLFIVLSACACTKKQQDNKFASYLPVQIGNTWVYQVTDTMEFAVKKDTQTVTITVIKDTFIDNTSHSFVVEENRWNYKRNIIWQLKNGELFKTGPNWNDNKILFRENPSIGDFWIIDTDYGNGTNFDDTSYVAEQYERYTFKDATGQAFKIQRDWSQYGKAQKGYTNEELYMPYIGLIKATYEYDIYGKHSETWTLLDYYTK